MGSSFKHIVAQKLKGENIDSKASVPQVSPHVASLQMGISSPPQVPFAIAEERRIPGQGWKTRQSVPVSRGGASCYCNGAGTTEAETKADHGSRSVTFFNFVKGPIQTVLRRINPAYSSYILDVDSVPKRLVRTMIRTMGGQSSQSSHGFEKPGPVWQKLLTATKPPGAQGADRSKR
ncbi:hypothetical protein B9Z19DRAFT_1125001 [Tuber borchii]|uniref:Uncharacterized protein n=1 Tax=Tuber borchii TaxID=42251 RepID=A0A2T6ZVW2_TUBBO|nr:hypothetical protein B9Z19DRAFT_1125001 [Tuber borchii]